MKKKLLVLPIIAGMVGVGISLGANNFKIAKAEGDESVAESVEEIESVEELESFVSEENPVEATSEQKEGVVKTFIDTYVVPIFATLGVGFFVSVAYGVIMAIVNGNRNKKMVASNQEAAQTVSEFIKLCGGLLETVKNNEELFIKMRNELTSKTAQLQELVNNYAVETKEMSINLLEEVKAEAKELAVETQKVLEIKKAMVILIELENTLAKTNPSAVSNGIVGKIAELNEQAKKLL